jgi:LPS-assembly protein
MSGFLPFTFWRRSRRDQRGAHRRIGRWGSATAFSIMVAASLISLQSLLFSQSASAQSVDKTNPVLFKADNLRRDRELGVVIATGNVEFSQNERTLLADAVTYNQRTDTVTASGNVSLLDTTGDVMFAEYIELSGDMKDGIARGIRFRLADNTRIAATGGRRIGGTRTEMRRAVYSPCESCRKNPDRTPIWQIKAYKVVRDLDEKQIEFTDAFLEIYGIPVAYIPYFSAPDPSVKRKTGFLIPSYGSDTELGTIIRAPYYISISPRQDATITPIYTGNEGPVLLSEYRNRFVGGKFTGRGSVTRGSSVDGDQHVRGHFNGGAEFDISDTWRGGIKASFASDDTYLRRYDFGSDTVLTSRAFVEGFRGRNYAAANAYYFQDLRADVDQATVPLAIPVVDYNFVGKPGRLGGRWSLDANFLTLTRGIGTDSRRISLKTGWLLPYTSRTGELYSLFGSLQTDAYWVDETQDPDSAGGTLSGVTGRAFPQFGLDWRFPLVRRGRQSAAVVEPIAGIIVSPNGGNPDKVPNEDSLDFELDDTNIFSSNRFTGVDRVEGGSRLYYGLRGSIYGSETGYATAFIGQSYRFRSDNLFAEGSGLEDNFSDLVGRVELVPQKYFRMLYRFRVDNKNLNPRRNEIVAKAGPAFLNLGTSYLFIEGQESSDAFPDREELSLTLNSQITEGWSLRASTLRDLQTGTTRSHSFGLTYKCSCLIFNASFTRSFTEDRDIKATDTIFFSVTLKNLGSFGGTRAFKKPEETTQ